MREKAAHEWGTRAVERIPKKSSPKFADYFSLSVTLEIEESASAA
jgi:hypothetical protein